MIDLSHAISPSPQVHAVPTDPGRLWNKNLTPAIDAPPDADTPPLPEAQWSSVAPRTGMFGAVSPRVVALPEGGYRLYYTQMMPRPGFSAGANDYGNSTTRILSATSKDGVKWTPEPGIRLSAEQGGADSFRVVSSEVIPVADSSQRLRMYYECSTGTDTTPNSIRSAISEDGGLIWKLEPGIRFSSPGQSYMSPRIVLLDKGRYRLYCCAREHGIISAISDDGLTFHQESGLRIAPDGNYDAQVAFATEIIILPSGRYVMYYAGYSKPNRAYILRAVSEDGLTWQKEDEPVISPEKGLLDAAKCSEMCIYRLPANAGQPQKYGIVYEGCDGTAKDERGIWRILSATASPK